MAQPPLLIQEGNSESRFVCMNARTTKCKNWRRQCGHHCSQPPKKWPISSPLLAKEGWLRLYKEASQCFLDGASTPPVPGGALHIKSQYRQFPLLVRRECATPATLCAKAPGGEYVFRFPNRKGDR